MHIVQSMHERKALMAQLSDGFVGLAGGFGTLEEFFEVLTWAQLGFHRKPVALLDTAGFYAPLVTALEHMSREGYIRPRHMNLIMVEQAIGPLLDRLYRYVPPPTTQWIDGAQT
jgi:uncharacterized protein (TIGR00730 family)